MGYLDETGLATLVGKVKGQVVQLTAAEYADLPATKNSDNKLYFVEDEEFSWKIDDEPTLNSEGLAKSGGIYTYTSKIGTGSLTTTAQTIIPAVNELKSDLTNVTNRVNGRARVARFGGSSTTSFKITCINNYQPVLIVANIGTQLFMVNPNNGTPVINMFAGSGLTVSKVTNLSFDLSNCPAYTQYMAISYDDFSVTNN